MKKTIALALALIFCMSTLVACDDDDVINLTETVAEEQTTDKEAEGETTTEPTAPAPVKVDSLNNKVPKQLWRGLFSSLADMTSMEITGEDIEKYVSSDSVYTTKTTMTFKMSGDDVYAHMFQTEYFEGSAPEVEDEANVTAIDGDVYIHDGDEKIKYSGTSLADVIGEDWFEELTGIYDQLPDSMLDKVEMYNLGDEYYFTVSVTAQNIADFNLDYDEAMDITARFDKNGAFKSISGEGKTSSFSRKISNVNKPITITAPSNADEYEVYSEVDSEGYEKYLAVCQKLKNAGSYSLSYSMSNPETHEMSSYLYELDSDGDQRVVYDGVTTSQVGNTYYSVQGGIAQVFDDTENVYRNIFAAYADMTVAFGTPQQDFTIKKLRYSTSPNGTRYIYIELTDDYQMSYEFNEEMTSISVTIPSEVENVRAEDVRYNYSNVDTGTVNIQAPVLSQP